MTSQKKVKNTKLLELTMRDVLGGLEDAATYINYRSAANSVAVLSIEPADQPMPAHSEVIKLNGRINLKRKIQCSENVVDYLRQREPLKTA